MGPFPAKLGVPKQCKSTPFFHVLPQQMKLRGLSPDKVSGWLGGALESGSSLVLEARGGLARSRGRVVWRRLGERFKPVARKGSGKVGRVMALNQHETNHTPCANPVRRTTNMPVYLPCL